MGKNTIESIGQIISINTMIVRGSSVFKTPCKSKETRMKCPTRIEQDLFDYLPPDKQAEVEEYLNEDELDDETIELMVREEPALELDEDRLRDEENERRTI